MPLVNLFYFLLWKIFMTALLMIFFGKVKLRNAEFGAFFLLLMDEKIVCRDGF